MLMAVAECACARSRSSGQGRRPVPQQPPPPASVAARLRPTVLRCWLAFGLVLPALPAPAQIVAYKNPPAGQTPTVLAAPNGVPLVYELDADLKPIRREYLGDPEAVAKAAAAVASQGKA